MDKLTAINIFLEVAKSGSFTATADKLELSRPMVTRYIALMEEWLNARLFHRTTRLVLLTEAGEQAVVFCQNIAKTIAEMEESIQPNDGELQGILRVSSNISFGASHLARAITDFQQLHPKLKVHLNLSDERVNLTESRIDLAIRFTNDPDPNLVARPLANCRSALVASPAYLAEHGTPEHPNDLLHHRCLAHANINRSEWTFKRADEQITLELTNNFSTNETTALHRAALDHNGIAMLPLYLISDDLQQGKLVPVLSDWQLPEYKIYALYLSRHKLPRATRALLDFLVGEFEGRDW